MFNNPTLVLIIVLVIAVIFAMGAYQLVINRYYWGPKGAPKKEQKQERDGK